MVCKSFTNSNAEELIRYNSNRLTYSALFHCQLENYTAPTYSIKYVIHGTERYLLDRKRFAVSGGNFLIVNSDRPVDLDISSSRKVTGFCIHLEKNWLQQCFAQLNYSESLLLDHPFHVSHIPDFDEILYSVKENHLGKYLQKLSSHFDLQSYTLPYEEEEVYYNLAYQLLSLQNSFKKEDRELCLLKSSTKKELLKRLSIAKQIIETQKGETLQVDYIAKQSLLSESHLFRSFKKVYGISPYQYFLKIRLSHAAGLLRMQKKTITEVALESGYPDLASFSKSFKKAYQYSPFEYMKQVRD